MFLIGTSFDINFAKFFHNFIDHHSHSRIKPRMWIARIAISDEAIMFICVENDFAFIRPQIIRNRSVY